MVLSERVALLGVNACEELPCRVCEVGWIARPVSFVPMAIDAACPFVTEVMNELGYDGHLILAATPCKPYTPLGFFCRLPLATVKVSPCYPIAMGCSRKLRTVGFKT